MPPVRLDGCCRAWTDVGCIRGKSRFFPLYPCWRNSQLRPGANSSSCLFKGVPPPPPPSVSLLCMRTHPGKQGRKKVKGCCCLFNWERQRRCCLCISRRGSQNNRSRKEEREDKNRKAERADLAWNADGLTYEVRPRAAWAKEERNRMHQFERSSKGAVLSLHM